MPKPLGHSAGTPRDHRDVQVLEVRRGPEGFLRADDGIRTRDPHLGKVMRYQLRYVRVPPVFLGDGGNSTRRQDRLARRPADGPTRR